MAGVSSAALQNLHAGVNRLADELRLRRPTARQVAKPVAFSEGQIPGGRLRALDDEGLVRAVPDGRAAADQAVGGEDAIVQRYADLVLDVLQLDIDAVRQIMVGLVAQHRVAISVFARDLQRRLEVARPAPGRKLLRGQHLGRVEGGELAAPGHGGQILEPPQRRAPIKILQRAVGVHPHRIGALLRGEQPDLASFIILDSLRKQRRRHKGQQ